MTPRPDLHAAIEHGRITNGAVNLTVVRALTAAPDEARRICLRAIVTTASLLAERRERHAAYAARAARDEASIARERGMEDEP